MINAPAALAGAAVGLGLVVAAAGWSRPEPDLRTTLARLDGRAPTPARRPRTEPVTHPPGREGEAQTAAGEAVERATRRAADWLASSGADLQTMPVVRFLRLDRLVRDLDLVDESVELLLVRKAGYAVLGLTFPAIVTAGMTLLGVTPPWAIPALAGLVLAAALFWVPELDVRTRAARARSELRRVTCAYIDLVALERAADAGPIEALERAADLPHAPAFGRIRAALTRARLDGDPPWQGLRDLAAATGVTELGDLADIMATSGRQGAAVYTSLRARATSLRTALTAQDTATANAASERMIIPVAVLGLVFMALLTFPALARILFAHP